MVNKNAEHNTYIHSIYSIMVLHAPWRSMNMIISKLNTVHVSQPLRGTTTVHHGHPHVRLLHHVLVTQHHLWKIQIVHSDSHWIAFKYTVPFIKKPSFIFAERSTYMSSMHLYPYGPCIWSWIDMISAFTPLNWAKKTPTECYHPAVLSPRGRSCDRWSGALTGRTWITGVAVKSL